MKRTTKDDVRLAVQGLREIIRSSGAKVIDDGLDRKPPFDRVTLEVEVGGKVMHVGVTIESVQTQ